MASFATAVHRLLRHVAAARWRLRPLRRSCCFGLLIALCLSALLQPASGVLTLAYCNTSAARPHVQRVDAVLYELGNTQYNATVCGWSFSQLLESHANDCPAFFLDALTVHTCPQHCLRYLEGRVYGSFPYHGNSSVCLAAIHAGVLSDEEGGGLMADRFYPLSWANDSTQTVFPHQSSRSSLSNGVLSLPVPHDWHSVPAPLQSFSWTVRSRGAIERQRQQAPYSPRAGHVHYTYTWQVGELLATHLVIGGHDATQYLNDVWLFLALRDPASYRHYDLHNGRWIRLPDAPFTPRSEVVYRPQHVDSTDLFNFTRTSAGNTVLLLLFGGQTRHSCGSRVLGTCSDEVWQLNITRVNSTFGWQASDCGFSFHWSLVSRLSFGGRCGMALVADPRWQTKLQEATVALVGGQLSYTDSQNCSAPIQTVNSVWLSSWPALSPWLPGRDAPFSPRRSMQLDDALLASDDLLIPPVGNYWDVAFDKSTSLTGGIRFIAHRWQPDTGTAIVTQAEVYADVWSCTLPTPEYDPTLQRQDCDWAHSYPIANLSRPPPYTPTASLPLPIAYSAHSEYRASRYHSLLRFGGVSSAAALQLWLSAVPTGAADVLQPVDWTRAPANVTLMQQPLFLNDATEQSPADFQALRFYMPLAFTLDEAELNSPRLRLHAGQRGRGVAHAAAGQQQAAAADQHPAPAASADGADAAGGQLGRASGRRCPQHLSSLLRLPDAPQRPQPAARGVDVRDDHRGRRERRSLFQ